MDKTFWWLLGVGSFLILGVLGFGAYKAYNSPKPPRQLPFFKQVAQDTTVVNGKTQVTPRYHTIPPFSFTNQHGQTITEANLKGHVAVVDFFFTTCQTICPKMTGSLSGIAKAFCPNPDFLILSHTVNPENDSVPVLVAYAKEKGITQSNWHLLTGNKAALYQQAREGYFLDASVGNGGPDDFVHTQLFALIDKEGHIRGYYDGTDPADLKRLDIDIRLLYQAYDYAKTNQMAW